MATVATQLQWPLDRENEYMPSMKISVSELEPGDEVYLRSEWGVLDKLIPRPDGLCAVLRIDMPTVYVNGAKVVTVRRNNAEAS